MTIYEFPELTDEAAHYWLKMDTWKPYDAAWLLCGIDPHGMDQRYGAFATELATRMCGDPPVSKAAFQVVELLKASSKAGSISFPAAPSAVIAWAKSKGLELPSWFLGAQFAGTEQAAPVNGDAGGAAKPEWMRQAWEIGNDWMLAEEKRTGERPIVVAIAKHVEGELSTRGITGARGKYLDWESIKRDALTGITGRGKGENFKSAMGNPHRKKKSPIVKA
jgi:hypothetical protein